MPISLPLKRVVHKPRGLIFKDCIFDFLPAQCALLRPWSNPKLECNVASKANDGITNVFTEKSHKYSLVFML